MQTKRSSLEEAVASTTIGFVISFLTQQFIINPLWHLNISIADNFGIITIFTIISIARQYIMRRIYNYRLTKGLK